MLTSNEPGVYKAGSHGIRTENLVLVVPAGEGMFGNYLQFETVTLCPICKRELSKNCSHQKKSIGLTNIIRLYMRNYRPA